MPLSLIRFPQNLGLSLAPKGNYYQTINGARNSDSFSGCDIRLGHTRKFARLQVMTDFCMNFQPGGDKSFIFGGKLTRPRRLLI